VLPRPAAGGPLAEVSPAATAQDLPTEKALPLELANEAAIAAVAACERDGHRVSVAVVDRSGVVKALLRGDGAGPHTIDSSRKKAYTAASLRRPTADYATMVAENPAVAGLRDMDENILLLGAGLPITVSDEVVGGIGVGGAPGGDLDAACAQAGIGAISDQLE
jgi:uncharacterized protein GlcG (DUF336 family)